MLLSNLIAFTFYLLILPTSFGSSEDDYYTLLGVEKGADSRDIRKAFKKLAVTKHPDKNKNDPEAHDHFVKLAEAYDVLKDPTKRNQYDMYGKKSFEGHSSTKYHSYTYYRDQFGIYDDDPLIATLGREDFSSSFGDTIWFVNFYSPLCSHCHELAPEWRRLSKSLEGVVKIGAVNCEDERDLCWELQIQQYPSLLFYDEKATMFDGKVYTGIREARPMELFIMTHLAKVIDVPILKGYPDYKKSPWVIFTMPKFNERDTLSSQHLRLKLAAVLKGIVSVGFTENKDFVETYNAARLFTAIFWKHNENSSEFAFPLNRIDHNGLADEVLGLFPSIKRMDQEDFQDIRTQLRIGADTPWLLCFAMEGDPRNTIMMKKFTGKLDKFKIAEVDCIKNRALCNSLHIPRYPTWAVLKKGGAFEMHTGQRTLHSIERFARDAQEATNIHALSPQDLQRIMMEGTPWIIGWLLTGCPPCKRMLPALRKASNHFEPEVIQFGTVDCAQHSHVCTRYNVNSYPTTAIYNASTVYTFTGESNEKSIIEFIQAMKSNYVISLTEKNFKEELDEKPESVLYAVEFYAPWCAPCQSLQPEWMKVAQKLSVLKKIKLGSVNCDLQRELCTNEGIRSYPTIRLYPMGSKGKNTMAIYSNPNRDYASLRTWVIGFMHTPMVNLDGTNFRHNLLSQREDRTWVIMFFAPWCGYCHEFEPEFFIAIQRLQDIVVGGKVNCQKDGALCQREEITSYPTVKLYQRIDGVTRVTSGITIVAYTQETLYAELKVYAAQAYITPVNHDEL
ncbi:dnaJ homolog subfamily C member 10-like [Arctopsyche grandis]|uniref:dnaJ homolog subfamily C member 10-like n=1 Tax=Arctopsyche grandis TaxID=121162 RepID=UPI00406DA29E